jgi:hypothetical protein
LNKNTTHYRWRADHFTRREYLFACFPTFCNTVLQFLHSLHFGRISRIIQVGYLQHSCFFARRKLLKARISQLTGLSTATAGHIITRFVETRINTRWPVLWWFTKQRVMWRHLAWGWSPPPLLHKLPKINGDYFPNSHRTYLSLHLLLDKSPFGSSNKWK